ncbi:hypothetical protein KL924_003318 [Ogataea haglerorum]|nr:hypothetical protein KL924_003318 [Ogataea haglerorum]
MPRIGLRKPNTPVATHESDSAMPILRSPMMCAVIDGCVIQMVPMSEPSKSAKISAVGKLRHGIHMASANSATIQLAQMVMLTGPRKSHSWPIREHDPRQETPDAEVRPHDPVVHFVDGLDVSVARLDQRNGDDVEKRADYGLCAHRPLVAVPGQQGLHADVVQDAAEPGARCREAQREVALAPRPAREPLRDDDDAGDRDQRERQALPDALGEHQLPELGAEGREQHRHELERNPDRDGGLEAERAHEIVDERAEREPGAEREPAHNAVLVLGRAGEHVGVEVLLVVERVGRVGAPCVEREEHAAHHGREPAAGERVGDVAGDGRGLYGRLRHV